MNLAPRDDFRDSPAGKFHAGLVTIPEFQAALKASLLQFIYDEGSPADPVITSAAWHRVAGARAFCHVLLNIAEPPAKPKVQPIQNLDHRL